MNRFKHYVSAKTARALLALGAVGLGLLVLIASANRVSFTAASHAA